MEEVVLNADKRDVLGKKNRFLRRQGITPTHLFGHRLESQVLQCDTVELARVVAHAGNTRLVTLKIKGDRTPKNVFLKEIQRDTITRQLLHVDLYQVKKGEKMQVNVPIVLVGESPALKGKGRMLSHGITELSIESLPEKVPPEIEVDISVLEEVEQALFVKDIVLDPDITVHADPEQLVVKISEIAVVAEEEEVEAEEEEGAEAAAEEGAEAKAPAGESESAETESTDPQ